MVLGVERFQTRSGHLLQERIAHGYKKGASGFGNVGLLVALGYRDGLCSCKTVPRSFPIILAILPSTEIFHTVKFFWRHTDMRKGRPRR